MINKNNENPLKVYSLIISIFIYIIIYIIYLYVKTFLIKIDEHRKTPEERVIIKLNQIIESKKEIDLKQDKIKPKIEKIKQDKDKIKPKIEKKMMEKEKNNQIIEAEIKNNENTQKIKNIYGSKFEKLSNNEKKYMLDNYDIMKKITYETLSQFGESKLPRNLNIQDSNIVEFFLFPDGSINDIKFIVSSKIEILNIVSKETIESSHFKYPKPKQKTLVRYKIVYNLKN